MFDHVSIGVCDLARSKRFSDAALRSLGYVCLMENADASDMSEKGSPFGLAEPSNQCDPTWDQAYTSAWARPHVRQSMHSISLPSTLAAPTTARRVCTRTMARTTTPPSWSTRRLGVLAAYGATARASVLDAYVAYPHSGLARKPQGSA